MGSGGDEAGRGAGGSLAAFLLFNSADGLLSCTRGRGAEGSATGGGRPNAPGEATGGGRPNAPEEADTVERRPLPLPNPTTPAPVAVPMPVPDPLAALALLDGAGSTIAGDVASRPATEDSSSRRCFLPAPERESGGALWLPAGGCWGVEALVANCTTFEGISLAAECRLRFLRLLLQLPSVAEEACAATLSEQAFASAAAEDDDKDGADKAAPADTASLPVTCGVAVASTRIFSPSRNNAIGCAGGRSKPSNVRVMSGWSRTARPRHRLTSAIRSPTIAMFSPTYSHRLRAPSCCTRASNVTRRRI